MTSPKDINHLRTKLKGSKIRNSRLLSKSVCVQRNKNMQYRIDQSYVTGQNQEPFNVSFQPANGKKLNYNYGPMVQNESSFVRCTTP